MNRRREQAATGIPPEVIADEPQVVAESMAEATQRLRDRGWMLAPLTQPVETPAEAKHRGSWRKWSLAAAGRRRRSQ